MNKEVLEKIIFNNKPYLLYDAQENKKIEGTLIVNNKSNNINVISKPDLNYLLETIDVLEFKLRKVDDCVKNLDETIKEFNLPNDKYEECQLIIEEIQNYL